MTSEYEKFQKELKSIINAETRVAYPIIGVIVDISSNRQFCSVETDDGVINNIPAHGMPVLGDSAIIHFINGNYEQPVADCARRLPTPASEIEEMYSEQCFNYHQNGDFENGKKGYTGTFELLEGDEDDDATGNGKCCILKKGKTISFTVDISSCESEVFKFQALYCGTGHLMIYCEDADTGKTIQTMPVNIAKEYSEWYNDCGRWVWTYNKEAYLRGNTKKVKFTIGNVYDETTTKNILINDEKVEQSDTMFIDAILVYDENADTNYYPHSKDVLATLKSTS